MLETLRFLVTDAEVVCDRRACRVLLCLVFLPCSISFPTEFRKSGTWLSGMLSVIPSFTDQLLLNGNHMNKII